MSGGGGAEASKPIVQASGAGGTFGDGGRRNQNHGDRGGRDGDAPPPRFITGREDDARKTQERDKSPVLAGGGGSLFMNYVHSKEQSHVVVQLPGY